MKNFFMFHKTSLGMIVLGILFILRTYLPEHETTLDTIIAAVMTFTGVALRHSATKIENRVETVQVAVGVPNIEPTAPPDPQARTSDGRFA